MKCPLCQSQKSSEYLDVTENVFKVPTQRTYMSCGQCLLVFLKPEQRISAQKEKARYDVHENNLTQPGYKSFLMQIWQPLKPLLSPKANGLDYGSGPTRALAELIEQDGFAMETYDPFFKPDYKKQTYDFITCTEVVEHVFDLNKTFMHFGELLSSTGHLAIMTELLTSEIDFKKWRYREDDTHVCFLKTETINYIAKKYSFTIEYFDQKRVVILKGTNSCFRTR